MQIPGVRVEDGRLFRQGGHHPGVAVTHMTDVIDAVQIGSFIRLEQVLTASSYDLKWCFIGQT